MRKADLEVLKDILDNGKLDVRCAIVKNMSVSDDRSDLFVNVSLFPEEIEMVVKMSWDHVGPDFGIFQFPSQNDLVLVAFCEGHEDEGYIIRRLTSSEDKIPVRAVDGHLVMAAKPGTKLDLNSDTQVNLTRSGDGNERLVLGDTFKGAYSSHLGEHSKHADHSSKHRHIGNLGFFTAPPDLESDFQAVKSAVDGIKSAPVDDEAMLSDLSKTEK